MAVISQLIWAGALAGIGATEVPPETKPQSALSQQDLCSVEGVPQLDIVGPAGMKAAYFFSVQDATAADMKRFVANITQAKFELQPLKIGMDGVDSRLVMGANALHGPEQIQQERETACGLKTGDKIRLFEVMYNREGKNADMKAGNKALAAAAMAVAAPASASVPPPVIVTTEASPTKPAQMAEFEIVMSAGPGRSWSGNLRVGNRGNATYEATTVQPHEACTAETNDTERYGQSQQRISVRLSQRDWRSDPNQFWVNARWQQPYPSCQGGGSSTLEFDKSATVAPGETAKLVGDGGLTVTLRRRK